ncbi:hypothetical protein AMTRI_Chr09g21620 [Amborella trichopoda]|uniref:RING-type E3 ubiquitin transferase n=1 Tax=Amborella trichopoda TaxID=13333 RepID=W1PZ75_AMBTC|nr:U-box domain-containing protein 43 [Amborella trichopoda]ERN13346.1 hypothetical protein AMTR_s00041p00118190 [Amborella trichopoda]|eukprot:XP_006851879.1 U-box domain-containing protein 43 [Amborella trichopoda]
MSGNAILEASLVPASEALSKVVDEIVGTLRSANDVVIEQKSFSELSSYLEKVVPVLKELMHKNLSQSESVSNAIEILCREVKIANHLISECSKRNRFYLLINCKKIVKQIQDTTREIGRALSLIPLALLEISSRTHDEIGELCDKMLTAEFKATVKEEKVLESIDAGIRERSANRSYANDLLIQIAEAVGVPSDRSAIKKEFDEFKSEMTDAQLRKNRAEAIQMEQIIALLEWADVASSPKERASKYHNKRKSLGNQLLEPLQPFYCPITQDVMVDPVEISSGQTFERSAIEKWFATENKICPVTKTPVTGELRPNITLRKSIEEWKDRNTMITIASMKPKLGSHDEQEVLDTLLELHSLCEERDVHREWIVMEDYIPLLLRFLGRNRSGNNKKLIRKQALTILCCLAKDSYDTRERIAEVDHAIEDIVRSLSRNVGERILAVSLLLELSENDAVHNRIASVKGCIFLLVNMLNDESSQAAEDACKLLDNLSSVDENVVQMAKTNYFKPLLRCLHSGSEAVKTKMATALAEMELVDHKKSSLFDEGALTSLLGMVSNVDMHCKEASIRALQNLSTVPKNGIRMIKEGLVHPLLDLLQLPSGSSQTLREHSAATLANLAVSATMAEPGGERVVFLESDNDIFRLFSLVNLTGPSIQGSILAAFHAMCRPPSATDMRNKLIEARAVQVLIQVFDSGNLVIRSSAVKLLFSLSQSSTNSSEMEQIAQSDLETLLNIIQTSADEEEKAAAMGIIANLPVRNTEITQWLAASWALPIIIRILENAAYSNNQPQTQLVENSAGVLCHLTSPNDVDCQRKVAEANTIPILVKLLQHGSSLTKRQASISLAQFSQSSGGLCRPLIRRRGFLCFAPPPERGCRVHPGICSVEESFCLVEAGAVGPLVRVLEDPDEGAREGALRALETLIEGERLQSGSQVIAEANGIMGMIRLLSTDSANVQEKALRVLERVFMLNEYRTEFGTSVQIHLVDITQRGNSTTKSLAARTLAHLNVLHDQSSYF